MELQDELRQAQVNLAHACAQNEVQAARQEVAEQKYELLAQQRALLEQHKDLLKQQVQSEQQQETQRYEPSGHVAAVAPAAPAGNDELTPEVQEGASLPASWLQCIFVNPHGSLVAHMTQALAFFLVNPHSSSLVDHMAQALAFFLVNRHSSLVDHMTLFLLACQIPSQVRMVRRTRTSSFCKFFTI